jgi:hypothetical protein
VPEAYKSGVSNAQNVIERSRQAEDLWATRVTAAAASRAREKGLANVSDADWKKAAMEKGSSRIASGMQASKGKFSDRMGRVLSTLNGIELPPRTDDVMANVTNRVGTIASVLHNEFKK